MTTSLDRPTTWENFKALSKDVQKEYLRHLAEAYHANTANLAEMFGVSPATIRRHVQSADLDIRFKAGHSMNVEQRSVWEQFLHSAQEYVVANEVKEEDRDVSAKAVSAGTIDSAPTPMRMSEFSLCFIGPINVEMIANSLRHILGDDASGEIRVVCSLGECS